MQQSAKFLKLNFVLACLCIILPSMANGQTLDQGIKKIQREVETNGSRYLVKRNTKWITGCFTPTETSYHIETYLKHCTKYQTCLDRTISVPKAHPQKTRPKPSTPHNRRKRKERP